MTGSIPNSFRNISSLEVFSAFFNQLGGSIPDSFGQLTKITVFNLGSNKLSGTIPPSFFNLSSMIDFNVGGNRIQGHLPLDIGITLPNIYFFSIIENQFTGSIPASTTNASNLYLLQLSNNKLHGNVPSLEKLNRMTHFRISNNNLGNGGENDLGFLCSLTNDTYLTLKRIKYKIRLGEPNRPMSGPKEGRAHSLCRAPDRTKAQTCPPRFRFLKACSARNGLGLQEEDLLYKEETCSARIRLALQG